MGREIIVRSEIEILELKSVIGKIKISRFSPRLEEAEVANLKTAQLNRSSLRSRKKKKTMRGLCDADTLVEERRKLEEQR